jgi:di/tricarboxylate transporter
MSDATIALVTLAVVIAVFLWNRLPVGIVAIGAALSLWATGLLDLDQALSGFGDPVVIFIATLFVVSEAIDASGLTTWAGQRVVSMAGDAPGRVLVALMAACAVLTALISLNGSVAALLPVVVLVAMRMGRAPSRMLLPVVYAGSAGSLLVLMGSPVNVIVSQAARDAGEGSFGFFEFAIVGMPVLLATIGLNLLLTDRVLPERTPGIGPPDLSRHAEVLAAEYQLSDGFYRLRVRDRSPLIGQEVSSLDLGEGSDLTLIAVQPGDATWSSTTLGVGDVLVVTGPTDRVGAFAIDHVPAVAMTPLLGDAPGDLSTREAGVAELVVPPLSSLVGEEVFAGMRRASDLVILAVQRQGRDLGDQPTELEAGDALLVYGAWPALDALVDDRSVLVVDSPDLLRRQTAPLGAAAVRTGIVVAAMVVLLATGAVPPAVAGLLAAGALVLSGALGSADAYRAVSWETVVLVGGLIPLSAAIQQSGAAAELADRIIAVVGDGSPMLLMLALFAVSTVLGLVISNTATVLIVLPIALAAAAETGISARPVLMLVAVAGSAALLTPIQTPGNMMVMAPGGYRFSDYSRLGLPILGAWLVIALVVIPIAWPF